MKLVDTSDVGVLIATHNPDLAKIGKNLFQLSEGRITV
jgi:ABC-type lipoprotein export system ATPase subunit